MKLIIGLGNLGEKYKNNRHNVGYMVADYSKKTKVFKTNTFMNDSGSFVSSQLKKTDIDFSKLYIIHDDLDIKLGEYKIQFGKGPKDHNGLNDIYDQLGTKEFWHIRIGVDNRDAVNRTLGEEYVLKDFTNEEMIVVKKIINKVLFELQTIN